MEERDVEQFANTKRGITRLAVIAAVSLLAGCQGGSSTNLFASSGSNNERPVQLLNAQEPQSSGAAVLLRQEVNEPLLAKAVERYRLNKKQKKSPYRSAGVDLNGDGQAEVMTLLEGDDWCANTGCTLAIFTSSKTGYRPVATIRRVWGPVTVTNERNNGWNDLVVNTGLQSRNQRVRLRFGSDGYPGNAVTLTPMPSDIDVNGEVVIERVDMMAQEMVSNSKP
jgi:hypothetical protein